MSKVDDAGFAKQIKAECKTLRTSIIQERILAAVESGDGMEKFEEFRNGM